MVYTLMHLQTTIHITRRKEWSYKRDWRRVHSAGSIRVLFFQCSSDTAVLDYLSYFVPYLAFLRSHYEYGFEAYNKLKWPASESALANAFAWQQCLWVLQLINNHQSKCRESVSSPGKKYIEVKDCGIVVASGNHSAFDRHWTSYHLSESLGPCTNTAAGLSSPQGNSTKSLIWYAFTQTH